MNLISHTQPEPSVDSGVPRSEGLHCSDLIKTLGVQMGLLPAHDGPPPMIRFLMGFTWEVMLEQALAEQLGCRPGEVSLDGVACSPDGIGCDEEGVFLEEYKCTWYSTKKTPEDIWHWEVQIKAYCHVIGLTRALMRVLYVNGDYQRPTKPQWHEFMYSFTEEELEENWRMLINHGKAEGLL
jgi:hypothetical protein